VTANVEDEVNGGGAKDGENKKDISGEVLSMEKVMRRVRKDARRRGEGGGVQLQGEKRLNGTLW